MWPITEAQTEKKIGKKNKLGDSAPNTQAKASEKQRAW
jgi:hypothetical protein